MVGLAMVLFTLSLRTFAGSLGVLLPEISSALGMSGAVAGVLTTLPLLVFAVVGPLAPRLVHSVGLRGAAVVALSLISAGLLARALSGASWLFLALTVVPLAGVALGNVLLPALVKAYFPGRVALVSSVSVALVVLGAAVSAATSVAVAQQFGSWRAGLGIWGAIALLAIGPWLVRRVPVRDTPVAAPATGGVSGWRAAFRSRVAWALVVAFATQSVAAYVGFGWLAAVYRSAGISGTEAGLLVGVLSLLGVPMGLLVPVLLGRAGSSPLVPWLWAGTSIAGWLGLAVIGAPAVWWCTVLLGIGSGAFPWTMAMVALHGRDVAETALLSGFVQSVGYLLAAAGPIVFGVLHDLTGSWTPSLAGMVVVAVTMGLSGTLVARSPAFGLDRGTLVR